MAPDRPASTVSAPSLALRLAASLWLLGGLAAAGCAPAAGGAGSSPVTDAGTEGTRTTDETEGDTEPQQDSEADRDRNAGETENGEQSGSRNDGDSNDGDSNDGSGDTDGSDGGDSDSHDGSTGDGDSDSNDGSDGTDGSDTTDPDTSDGSDTPDGSDTGRSTDPSPDSPGSFDPSDPHDYVWTVRTVTFHTLRVLGGTTSVDYEWFEPGADPDQDAPRASGVLEKRTTLLRDIPFRELVGGGMHFWTYRTEDELPMTSCAKAIGRREAIRSHNEILQDGYPLLPPTEDYTDPSRYRDALRAEPGVVMLVNGDCDTAHPDNPTEERSVLSWLAVTFEAQPNPELVDGDPPEVRGGIDPGS